MRGIRFGGYLADTSVEASDPEKRIPRTELEDVIMP